jgi:DNA modification methylase
LKQTASASNAVNAEATSEAPTRNHLRARPVQLSFFDGGERQKLFAPLDATFQQNKEEPLHNWFPYLEGFGPDFVQSVFANYLPSAKRIIDPFVGSGTTPLVLSSIGVECGYCEANPVMREVTRIKTTVAALNDCDRGVLASRIRALAKDLPDRVKRAKRDESLESNYHACFGKSVFFTDTTFDIVLRLRALADDLQRVDSFLGDALFLATLSKIVICSQLKRAGDVRYKTEEELQKAPTSIVAEIREQLELMALDCLRGQPASVKATLLGFDARSLDAIPSFHADGVITSPPYLNGTNYIRNTKLELWFSRFLKSSDDLRAYRDMVVTAGINDVAGDQNYKPVTESVGAIVAELEKDAYDQRIPRMVAAYFGDMAKVFRGLHRHTTANAVVCIDIGDSRYGGVHVPTHSLLGDVSRTVGFNLVETVKLRTRLSKDKTPLTQELLIFKKATRHKASSRHAESWQNRWQRFKTDLPHQKPPFTKRNWGSPLHSLCSYHGKMKPALAYHLVNTFTEPGDVILDPFSGAGTIPFEAALNGRFAFAMDISQLSFAISQGKLTLARADVIAARLEDLRLWLESNPASEQELQSAKAVKFNGPVDAYFHEKTFQEVVSARKFFAATRDDSPEWAMMMASMLHILHGNRPYALSRRSHPITPFSPTGPATYKSVVKKLQDKLFKSLEETRPESFVPGKCFQTDALQQWPDEIRDLDAVITSPPFFDSTRFYMTNWMRFWFCGWERADFDEQPARFLEQQQKQSLNIYKTLFSIAQTRLKKDGLFILHLGASRKCDMGKELSAIGAEHFEVVDCFNEDVQHCESHGVTDKGTVTGHQYLVLRNR